MSSASSRRPDGFKVHAAQPEYLCSSRFVSHKASRVGDVTCIKCLRRMPQSAEVAARVEQLRLVRAPAPRFAVYALELPSGEVYVGSTAQLVRERLAEHRERFGPRTRLLASIERGVSRQDVEARERAVAADLRQRGYKVRQG